MTAKTNSPKAAAKKLKTAKNSTRTTVELRTSAMGSDSKRSLRTWNLWLGAVLLVLAVAVVAAGGSSSVPLTVQYLSKDALASEAAGGGTVLAPAIRHLTDVHVSWLVAAFLVITGLVFLLAATLWRKRYEAWLDRGVNKLRWAGLGLAGGVAVATVAMLGGVSDLATLLLIFGSVVLAGAFAAALELLGGGRRLQRLLAAGAMAGFALPWFGLVANVAGVLRYNGSLPTYLYYVCAVVTLWFVAIVLATYFRNRQLGKWADTFYTERAFMLLGFSAVVVLALQIFTGVLL